MTSDQSKSGNIIGGVGIGSSGIHRNEVGKGGKDDSLLRFVDPKAVEKVTRQYSEQIKQHEEEGRTSQMGGGGSPELQSALVGPQDDSALHHPRTRYEVSTNYYRQDIPLSGFNSPQIMIDRLAAVSYECQEYLAVQLNLFLNIPSKDKVKSLLLEGPSGCGKSYLAKSLAKITDSELMVLSCYPGMVSSHLIESPSNFAIANAMAKKEVDKEDLMNLGIISRAYLKSQTERVIFLIDELDKPEGSIDTFFLGPIQDGTIWLESRPPIRANPDNIILIFTKNFNRTLDEALLRRVHPIKMTYLDSTLERKILSPFCDPILIANLVEVADRMRYNQGTYAFERPPAPEELLLTGKYVVRLLEWQVRDFAVVGESVFNILSKSEHDRAVLEHMLRHHPEYSDPLWGDPKGATIKMIYKRLGQAILKGIVHDPEAEAREKSY